MEKSADIGLIGLAVMGQNLALNIADHNYNITVYNRSKEKTDHFISTTAKDYTNVQAAFTLKDLTQSLRSPRKIILMIKAGPAVDATIQQLMPLLEPGDIIIDGGNSYFKDTIKRAKQLEENQILYVGSGISGGEEGARRGPSIMPGGNSKAWDSIQPILQSIAAKNDDGSSCCRWIGDDGAGHYVKMVHNGIEYGDMQIISETYDIMHRGMSLSHEQMYDVYSQWNETELNSYLIEITRNILKKTDTDGSILLTKIVDAAQQKGTGKWTSISANELNSPVTLISEAVFARFLSAQKQLRTESSKILQGPDEKNLDNYPEEIEKLRLTLLASKIISYTQGFMLLQAAAEEYNWELNYSEIANIWRNGCIIKSVFLDRISDAYLRDSNLKILLSDTYFNEIINKAQQPMREMVAKAQLAGIPTPSLSSALAFYDSIRTNQLPANLIQAQRDYFGAHLYERTDSEAGKLFHTEWDR